MKEPLLGKWKVIYRHFTKKPRALTKKLHTQNYIPLHCNDSNYYNLRHRNVQLKQAARNHVLGL